MTAYTHSAGGNVYFDGLAAGSANATLDTHAISNQTALVVRTDTYACANHTIAGGSLDTVTFSGTGGELRFDPTYVRVIAYTGGSGNSPAYGAAISQGGVSGVFLGCWTNWLSDPIVAGAAIGATGYMKIGGKTGGDFAAGALTGITATCSGPDVQGWIEVKGPDTATITVPRIGKVTSTEAWFEIGTTNGARGQIIACPTTVTAAGVWPGVWIESAAGSGVYERYAGIGSVVALATHRTTAEMKVVTQTTGGIRIGNDGTNGVFYLPPTGCKVRIPATILTNCTRSASGSGPRVLPNATIATRQELVTTGAGYFDLRNLVCQWYMNFSQPFYVKYLNCAVSDSMILSEVASALDVNNCIVGVTQAQINTALAITSCFAGGTVANSDFWSFSLATSGRYVAAVNYVAGVAFSGNVFASATLRGNATTGAIGSTQAVNCSFTANTFIGGRGSFLTAQNCTFAQTVFYNHTITTTTTSTNPQDVFWLSAGSANNLISDIQVPNAAVGPYTALVSLTASYSTTLREFGTYAAPVALNSSVTGLIVSSSGNSDGIKMQRLYVSNTRTGPYAFVNSDTNILVENCAGDYADTTALAGLNALVKNCALAGATTGQVSVYGTHWMTRFTSATAGFAEVLCNEPTSASAAQCWASGGAPQFNSSGSVVLALVGDQVTWEMPYFAIGYTAFTNSAPTITGTNVTFGTRWGNHDIEFQVDTGAGYGGTWLNLTAANLIAQTFNSTNGYKLKIRATCAIAAATNLITNMRVALTTTSTDQGTKLYPMSVNTVSFSGVLPGTDMVVLIAGTSTVLYQVNGGGNLVEGGSFDNSTDALLWGDAGNSTCSVVGDELELVSSGTGDWPTRAYGLSGLTIGAEYLLTAKMRRGTASSAVAIEAVGRGLALFSSSPSLETVSGTFTASATYHEIFVYINAGGVPLGATAYFDDISVTGGPVGGYSYTYSGAQSVDVGFIKPGYKPFYIRGLSLATADSSIPVSLSIDRSYQ